MTTTDRLRALLAEATPGPWQATEKRGKRDGYVRSGDRTLADMRLRNGEADAALIVAAVNALPALLDVADAARRFVAMQDADDVTDEYATAAYVGLVGTVAELDLAAHG